jgi:RNA polymerase sigma-70 factor (ECF subfamily)
MSDRVTSDVGFAGALEYDAELMLRVREGDAASFAILLGKHREPLVHFLARMTGSAHVGEELAQEAFLRVYRSRERYEPTAKFTTYLYRIATHLALNRLRDGRHERRQSPLEAAGEVAARELTVEQRMLREGRRAEVRDAIAALPDKQRAAVLMHKYQELGYAQIAAVLGCTESAVKSLLFRAYETLRGRLAHLAG